MHELVILDVSSPTWKVGWTPDDSLAANAVAAEGTPVDHDDFATITPYITHAIRRLGDLALDLNQPDTVPVTRLDLESRALFPTGPAVG